MITKTNGKVNTQQNNDVFVFDLSVQEAPKQEAVKTFGEQILSLSKVYKSYNKQKMILKDINFDVHAGEFISIIGPSGAGKSTLLRTINRMIEIDKGTIQFNDVVINQLNKKDLRKTRAEIGMIFQHYNLVNRLSVFENVLHGRFGHKSTFQGVFNIYTEAEKKNAVDIINQLGIGEHIYKRCDELSGGQKQRVGIARALVQEPKLILCDEPIASLDPSASKVIMDHLKRITEEMGITCIVNLHQVDVAKKYSDRIIGLNAGEIVYDGKPEGLDNQVIQKIYGTEADDLITE
ncbi:phosphonate ABC transporter ATP-binding protein [Macrococcoides caseolyticum]|uniref:phosphonate ABC transporter ATP-binding protein n=1 Tax=Macrococcoides caseolyticum TaxID=69966 RepID=UPI002278E754|nr:phosphonate ABC transporter ATP-binding protein [Macrococcus caseolyticus]MCE4956008.1 phosphonate ABC transporter ATP-binding protein [Macrococcus caseolyticus]